MYFSFEHLNEQIYIFKNMFLHMTPLLKLFKTNISDFILTSTQHT